MVSIAKRDIRRTRQVLEYAERIGNIRKACQHFRIPRSLFYVWRDRYAREGDAGLVIRRPCAHSCPHAMPQVVVEQILHLRRTSHLGPVGGELLSAPQSVEIIKSCDPGRGR